MDIFYIDITYMYIQTWNKNTILLFFKNGTFKRQKELFKIKNIRNKKKKTIKALEEKIEKTSPKLVQKYRCRKLERIDKKIEGLIQEAQLLNNKNSKKQIMEWREWSIEKKNF